MDFKEGIEKLNSLGKKKEPFVFIIPFNKDRIFIENLNSSNLLYDFKGVTNSFLKIEPKLLEFKKYPISFKDYKNAFNSLQKEFKKGNSYLANLTFPTKIETNLELKEIFYYSKAPFKLYFKDKFVSFSPEPFIILEKNKISTYPMKGTIKNIKNAKEKILTSKKELSEHIMIVDLMRNDLNIVAKNIRVKKFRYVEKINKELLQVSSKIVADINNWEENIGTILDKLTPAGSITGTPKRKTVEILKEIENYNRGFYTGIFGIFDGKKLISSVTIRYIEKENNNLFYKSGGGITLDSNLKLEYQELIDKVAIPNF